MLHNGGDDLNRWPSEHTCHHPHGFSEFAIKREKCHWKPRVACVNVRHPAPTNPLAVLPVHAGVKGNDGVDRLADKVTITSGLCLRISEMLSSLSHYMRSQSQGHHIIDHLEERGVERGSARRSSLKGRERAIVSQTNIGTVLKATLGNFWEIKWSAYGLSECRIDTIWKWTE